MSDVNGVGFACLSLRGKERAREGKNTHEKSVKIGYKVAGKQWWVSSRIAYLTEIASSKFLTSVRLCCGEEVPLYSLPSAFSSIQPSQSPGTEI